MQIIPKNGPYRVLKCTSPNVYLLVNTQTGRRIRRNLDKIRIIPNKSRENENLENSESEASNEILTPTLENDQNARNENNLNLDPDAENLEPEEQPAVTTNKRVRKTPKKFADYQL